MSETTRDLVKLTLLVLAIMVAGFMVTGCARTPAPQPAPPPQAPPAVEVLIPTPVPCEIAQVPSSPLPSAGGFAADIFDAVKVVLADRATLLADRERLQAANRTPCPGGSR